MPDHPLSEDSVKGSAEAFVRVRSSGSCVSGSSASLPAPRTDPRTDRAHQGLQVDTIQRSAILRSWYNGGSKSGELNKD